MNKSLVYVSALACAWALGCAEDPMSSNNNNNFGSGAQGGGTGAMGGGTGATGGGTGATGGGTGATGGGTGATGGGTGGEGGDGDGPIDCQPSGAPAGDDATLCSGLTFDPGENADGTCKPDGVWAIKATFDTWWDMPDGDTGFDNRGTYTNWLLQTVEVVDAAQGTLKVTNKVCKEDQPPSLSDTLCAAFQTVIPDATFDKLDPIETKGRYTCLDKNSNCAICQAVTTTLNGIDMSDPNGPFPATGPEMACAAGTGAVCYPDQDGDGHPGITASFKDDVTYGDGSLTDHSDCPSQSKPYQYRFAPPSAGLGALTDTIEFVYAGSRTRMGVPSRIIGDSCGCGTAKGVIEMKDTRVFDCEVRVFGGLSTRPCQPAEADFIDSKANKALDYDGLAQGMKLPVEGEVPPANVVLDSHAPSPGPIFRAIRLGDAGGGFSCSDVLGTTFPEPDISLPKD